MTGPSVVTASLRAAGSLTGSGSTPSDDASTSPGVEVDDSAWNIFSRPCGDVGDTTCSTINRLIGNERVSQVIDWFIGTPLTIVAIVFVAVVVRFVALRAIRRAANRIGTEPRRRGRLDIFEGTDPITSARRAQRAKAIGSLLAAAVSVVVWVVAVFLVLPKLGIEITGLVAGAGVLGLALAFGAQTLVSDLVIGIFMIAEDQYGVGDVIDMGEASGVVEAVGLRTTRLRAVDGTVWHVRNGEVKRVGNMSQGWSRALLDIEVAYQEDVTHVMDVLKQIGHDLREDQDFGSFILDEPEMWGVEAFGENSVVIRMILKTEPLKQWMVAREMRRRIKHEFDRLGIEIPFPQRALWIRAEGPGHDEVIDGYVGSGRDRTERGDGDEWADRTERDARAAGARPAAAATRTGPDGPARAKRTRDSSDIPRVEAPKGEATVVAEDTGAIPVVDGDADSRQRT